MPKIDVAVTDLRTVVEILRKHLPTRKIVAFGSRVTGRAKPFSDLDLAILGDDPVPSSALAALADEFDESTLPFKVRPGGLGDDARVLQERDSSGRSHSLQRCNRFKRPGNDHRRFRASVDTARSSPRRRRR